jgi:hypothetical protein
MNVLLEACEVIEKARQAEQVLFVWIDLGLVLYSWSRLGRAHLRLLVMFSI